MAGYLKAKSRGDDGLAETSAEEGAYVKLNVKLSHYINKRLCRYK